jgi:hypothetical protein
MKKTTLFILLMSIMTSIEYGAAQGCSDAGICSISSFKPTVGEEYEEQKNEVKFGFSTGGADHMIAVFGGNISYTRRLGSKLSLNAKATLAVQTGNDVSVTGPGDVYLNLDYKVAPKFTITGGVKIPLTDGNKLKDDKPLPMDYQSSLGTTDLVLGLGYRLEKWQWVLALQQPLTQNENAYFPSIYGPGSPLGDFQATNQFERKGDLLLRVSYPISLRENIMFTPGLLPIYHLGEDEYTDMDGTVQTIEGSEGLTLNATLFMDIALSLSSSLELNVGFPFIVRESRPDGLTRGYVMGAEYAIRF